MAEGEDILNEVFATAWEIACKDGEVDSAFWAHVRLLAERCRTDDDWQGLLGVLLQISLSDKAPPLDREPIYRWSIDQRVNHGLRAARPRRKRSQHNSAMAAAAQLRTVSLERKAKRARLRAVLDGAPDASVEERDELARWLLDDIEANEAKLADEREVLAEEMQVALRKVLGVAREWKAKAEALELEAQRLKQSEEPEEIDFGAAEDTLRAAAGDASTGSKSGVAEPASSTAGAASASKLESKASQLKHVDEHAAGADLEPLANLLQSDHEDVCVKAALAITALCARDEDRQQALCEAGALPRIAALVDRDDFSARSLLDITLCLKALTANRFHHVGLIKQFLQASGPRRLVKLIGAAPPELSQAALQIVRSLADVEEARRELVAEAVLPPLLRCLRPATPTEAVEPAAAAVAILVRFEPECSSVLLDGGGLPSLVQLLGRGPRSLAAHSAASALAALCRDAETGADARRHAREARALEAVVPLLDGVLGGSAASAATATAACDCLGALCTGSSALAADLRTMGALQSVVGLLSAKVAPNGLKVAACDSLAAATANDLATCAELKRLGAVRLLATLVKGGTKKVATAAQAVLSMLTQRDASIAEDVEGALRDASEGAPLLVAQLSQGRKLARRAALLLDELARQSIDARDQVVRLGAVPRLVKLARRGHHDVGTLNAIGCLEVLSHQSSDVQDEARAAGIFTLLPDLIRPYNGPLPDENHENDATGGAAWCSSDEETTAAEAGADDDGGGPPDPVELRHNAALCLKALVEGNTVSREAAKKAGAVEALATLLDEGEQSQGAYLAAMGLKAFGMTDSSEQERALQERSHSIAAEKPDSPEVERLGQTMPARVETVKRVWMLTEEPQNWRGAGGRREGGNFVANSSAGRRASTAAKRSIASSLLRRK